MFGGTFDPPHIGHLILAEEARSQLSLDRLLWVLTPAPPHKQGETITSVFLREQMVHAAIAGNPGFTFSRLDLERSPPHYTVDTLRALLAQDPDARPVYLMGGDSLHDLPTWKDPQKLIALCETLGVMRRPGDTIDLSDLEKEIPGISLKTRFIDAPLLEISSTQIRRRVARGEPFRYYVPPPVYHFIQAHGVYRQAE